MWNFRSNTTLEMYRNECYEIGMVNQKSNQSVFQTRIFLFSLSQTNNNEDTTTLEFTAQYKFYIPRRGVTCPHSPTSLRYISLLYCMSLPDLGTIECQECSMTAGTYSLTSPPNDGHWYPKYTQKVHMNLEKLHWQALARPGIKDARSYLRDWFSTH